MKLFLGLLISISIGTMFFYSLNISMNIHREAEVSNYRREEINTVNTVLDSGVSEIKDGVLSCTGGRIDVNTNSLLPNVGGTQTFKNITLECLPVSKVSVYSMTDYPTGLSSIGTYCVRYSYKIGKESYSRIRVVYVGKVTN